MKFDLVEVPPPSQVRVDPNAKALGLIDGVKAERSRRQYRCDQCFKMQQPESWMVWVPDGIRKRDPAWSMTEACRMASFNGHWSAWCLSCAPKKSAYSVAKDSGVWGPVIALIGFLVAVGIVLTVMAHR